MLELTLPKDAPFTAAELPAFAKEAEALGLAQDVAQKLVDYRAANWPKPAGPPEKYELTAPANGVFKVADLEAIGVEARELGLTNEAAQKLVDLRAKSARVAPADYKLAAPEGSGFGAPDLELFAGEAKALGLTAAEAQQLVATRATALAGLKTKFLDELKADKDLGGDKFTATQALAVKGRDALFPPGAEETAQIVGWLNQTGFGNHKGLVRAFARLGSMLAEDTMPGGHGAGGGAGQATLADRMYPVAT